jgi:maleate isomerase
MNSVDSLGPSTRRIGLVVPSSNVTMEIEVPELMRASDSQSFSFHSSRMRMQQVSAEELAAMNSQALRCVDELADAQCDVLAYACLIAVMVQGPGAHRIIEKRLADKLQERGQERPVISSAGALVETIVRLDATRVAIVTPYVPALTEAVIGYLEAEDITVTSHFSLGVADNFDVGCIPSAEIERAVDKLDLGSADLLVLSACVQMPSLGLLNSIADMIPVPVITASSCTAAAVLSAIGGDVGGIAGGAARAWAGSAG